MSGATRVREGDGPARAATPEALEARLAALRREGAALRRRPAGDTLRSLAAVLDGWRDPASPWRAALERALPPATGFAPETVREGLVRGLAPWTGDALHAVARRELGRPDGSLAEGHDTTAVLLAGSIPMPSLLSLVAPLALRSPVLAKTASRDPVTAPLVARSVAEVDPELGRCLAVTSFPGDDAACVEAFARAGCVVATGSDETVDAVARHVRAPRVLVRHGHRLSAALLGPEATRGEALARATRGLALDAALWDQLGCLSPVAVWVADAGAEREAVERVAEALAAALDAVGRRLPRGAVEARAAAAATQERASAELRAAAGGAVSLRAAPDASWTVVAEDDPAPRPAPLHRFLRVHPAPGPDPTRWLTPWAAHLAAVALDGFGPRAAAVADALHALGASRVCAPGTLQAPPLDWPRDGVPLLASLARQPAP